MNGPQILPKCIVFAFRGERERIPVEKLEVGDKGKKTLPGFLFQWQPIIQQSRQTRTHLAERRCIRLYDHAAGEQRLLDGQHRRSSVQVVCVRRRKQLFERRILLFDTGDHQERRLECCVAAKNPVVSRLQIGDKPIDFLRLPVEIIMPRLRTFALVAVEASAQLRSRRAFGKIEPPHRDRRRLHLARNRLGHIIPRH